jgi:hypothetical protein
MSTPNFWTTSQIDFLNKLKLQCLAYSEFNRKQVNKYTKTNTKFNIPILILSGFNSFIALGFQPFIKQEYISIINSILSLTCGILSSTALYMKYNEKINTCVACSHELNDLHATIFKELSLDEDSRSMDGKDFCNKMFDEYTKIMQKHLIPKKTIQMFLVTDNEKQYNELSILHNQIISSKSNSCKNNVDTDFPEPTVTKEDDDNITNDIEKDQPQINNNEISSKKEFSMFGMFTT